MITHLGPLIPENELYLSGLCLALGKVLTSLGTWPRTCVEHWEDGVPFLREGASSKEIKQTKLSLRE